MIYFFLELLPPVLFIHVLAQQTPKQCFGFAQLFYFQPVEFILGSTVGIGPSSFSLLPFSVLLFPHFLTPPAPLPFRLLRLPPVLPASLPHPPPGSLLSVSPLVLSPTSLLFGSYAPELAGVCRQALGERRTARWGAGGSPGSRQLGGFLSGFSWSSTQVSHRCFTATRREMASPAGHLESIHAPGPCIMLGHCLCPVIPLVTGPSKDFGKRVSSAFCCGSHACQALLP